MITLQRIWAEILKLKRRVAYAIQLAQSAGAAIPDNSIAEVKLDTPLTTKLNAKADQASPTFTGTVVLPATTSIGTVSNTELGYVDGVTSAIQTQMDAKAPLASPTFTGTPALPTGTTAITQSAADSTTKLATTAFVTTADNLKANLAGPTFTGTPTLPTGTIGVTQSAGNSTTALATTAFVTTADNLKANLASPTFTGTPTLPTGSIGVTQAAADNTTALATTAHVFAERTNTATLTNKKLTDPTLTERSTTPSTTANTSTVYSLIQAGRNMVSQASPTGYPYRLQPFIGAKTTGYLAYEGGNTVGKGWALTFSASADVPAAVNVDVTLTGATGLFNSMNRAAWTTVGTAGGSKNVYGIGGANSGKWFLSNTALKGGFMWVFTAGIAHAATVANARAFVGIGAPTVIGNVEPNTLVNIIGFAFNGGGTNWKVMHNDGSGVATEVDLGATYPSATLSTDWYQFTLYAPPASASNVYYHVLRVNTGDETSGTLSTNLPAADFGLNWQVWINNGSTALAATIHVGHIYVETQF